MGAATNRGETNEQIKQRQADLAPALSDGCCSGRCGDRGRTGRDRTDRPDQHALAEHVAVQGHFPRIRPRLRQEGQRHDRRRPEDRGAAGGRRGAGLRPARCRLQGRARRRPWRAGLSLRQADRAGAVGLRPGLCHGRQHAAVLAPLWRRQGTAREALRLDQRQRGVVPLRADADASRSAGSRSRSPRPTISRASNSAPSASRSTCTAEWAQR